MSNEIPTLEWQMTVIFCILTWRERGRKGESERRESEKREERMREERESGERK